MILPKGSRLSQLEKSEREDFGKSRTQKNCLNYLNFCHNTKQQIVFGPPIPNFRAIRSIIMFMHLTKAWKPTSVNENKHLS